MEVTKLYIESLTPTCMTTPPKNNQLYKTRIKAPNYSYFFQYSTFVNDHCNASDGRLPHNSLNVRDSELHTASIRVLLESGVPICNGRSRSWMTITEVRCYLLPILGAGQNSQFRLPETRGDRKHESNHVITTRK